MSNWNVAVRRRDAPVIDVFVTLPGMTDRALAAGERHQAVRNGDRLLCGHCGVRWPCLEIQRTAKEEATK